MRRLRAAWRVGRLRSALPDLSRDLIEGIDADLGEVPALGELSGRQLLALLHRASEGLTALHGHEILVGLLTTANGQPDLTGTSVALRVLARARDEGMTDEDVVSAHPVVLALTAPRIGGDIDLPPTQLPLGPLQDVTGQRDALLREALRLRVRWVQELQARAALALGQRLAEQDALPAARLIRRFRLAEVEAVVYGRATPWEVHDHRRGPETSPLPGVFRMSADGAVLPDRSVGAGSPAGQAAVPVARARRHELLCLSVDSARRWGARVGRRMGTGQARERHRQWRAGRQSGRATWKSWSTARRLRRR